MIGIPTTREAWAHEVELLSKGARDARVRTWFHHLAQWIINHTTDTPTKRVTIVNARVIRRRRGK